MLRVAEECMKMNQNKELQNKLRSAFLKSNVFEYSLEDYMRLFRIISTVPQSQIDQAHKHGHTFPVN